MPRAVRRNAKITMRRVKLVMTKIKDGAKTKRVMTNTTFRVVTS